MSNDLLYELKNHVAFLTINREDRRNSISQEMIISFLDYLATMDQDEEIRAVCLTGTGEKAFCSGADLGTTLAGEGADRLSGPRNYARLLKEMAKIWKAARCPGQWTVPCRRNRTDAFMRHYNCQE